MPERRHFHLQSIPAKNTHHLNQNSFLNLTTNHKDVLAGMTIHISGKTNIWAEIGLFCENQQDHLFPSPSVQLYSSCDLMKLCVTNYFVHLPNKNWYSSIVHNLYMFRAYKVISHLLIILKVMSITGASRRWVNFCLTRSVTESTSHLFFTGLKWRNLPWVLHWLSPSAFVSPPPKQLILFKLHKWHFWYASARHWKEHVAVKSW